MKRSGQGTSQQWGRISKICGPTIFLDTVVTSPRNEPEFTLREAAMTLLALVAFLACIALAALAWM